MFGIDPELFVVKKGGRLATSIHLLKGFKTIESYSVGSTTGGVWSKMDGFAFEFSSEATSCRDYLFPSIANGILDFHKAHPDYKLDARASMKLTKASVQGNVPEGVCEYGCVPDIDAFKLEEKTPEFESYQTMDRFTGGHIHWNIGGYSANWNPTASKETMVAAYALLLDAWVGVPFVAAIGEINDYGEALRRTYYGQAGSHRVKPYGIEYRVLSGMFLSSPFMTTWALGATRKIRSNPLWTEINRAGGRRPINRYDEPVTAVPAAVELKADDAVKRLVKELFKTLELDRVRDIINNHDVKEARKYAQEARITKSQYMPEFIDGMIRADKHDIGINMNLMESWKMKVGGVNAKMVASEDGLTMIPGKQEGRALHHNYPGVEKMMRANEKRVTAKQFPPRADMVLEKGNAWL